MEIATEKTKTMVISKDSVRCKLAVENKIVEYIHYGNILLGSKNISRGKVEEVSQQTNKASRVAGCLNDTIWRNRFLTMEVKTRNKTVMICTSEIRRETRSSQNIY